MNEEKQKAFLDWLGKFPEWLAMQARIVDAFARAQGEAPKLPDAPALGLVWPGLGPLNVRGISVEQLDAAAIERGEAIKKGEVIAYVKGFFTGVVVAAG